MTRAHEQVGDDVTDDASMVEALGGTVKVFMGSHANLKITTREDMAVADALIASGALNGAPATGTGAESRA